MKAKKGFRIGLGLAVAGLFLWLIFRQTSLEDIVVAFRGTHFAFVAAGIGALGLGYAARIERWRLMLLADNGALRFRDCAGPFVTSFAMNNVLPLRAGDVARLFAFRGRLGITLGTGAAALFVERMLDLIALLVLFGLALAIFGGEVSGILGLGGGAAAAVGFVLLAILLVPALLAPAYRLVRTGLQRLPRGKGQALAEETDRAFETLIRLSKGGRLLRLVVLSGLAWALEGLTFTAAALAMPGLTAVAGAWLALPVGSLSTLVPGAPGYAGTFHYFVSSAMQSLGTGAAAATAYAVLIHAMLWLPITAAGALALLFAPPAARENPFSEAEL
ncbi:MAG: lysylphosphatidylglycerol synthase transmembrane domain-containing protein [Pseudomonadota bacterium]